MNDTHTPDELQSLERAASLLQEVDRLLGNIDETVVEDERFWTKHALLVALREGIEFRGKANWRAYREAQAKAGQEEQADLVQEVVDKTAAELLDELEL